MTLEDALERPFEEYLAWCRDYVRAAAARDATLRAVLDSCADSGGPAFLEAGWARRYWFHHARRVGPQ